MDESWETLSPPECGGRQGAESSSDDFLSSLVLILRRGTKSMEAPSNPPDISGLPFGLPRFNPRGRSPKSPPLFLTIEKKSIFLTDLLLTERGPPYLCFGNEDRYRHNASETLFAACAEGDQSSAKQGNCQSRVSREFHAIRRNALI